MWSAEKLTAEIISTLRENDLAAITLQMLTGILRLSDAQIDLMNKRKRVLMRQQQRSRSMHEGGLIA